MFAQKRYQNKDGPQTVNHAGDGSEQFGKERERTAEELGAHFREEDGHTDGKRNRDN